MKVTVQWIADLMDAWAPQETAESWDNTGLLVGDMRREARRVLTALDAGEAVLGEAVRGGYDLLVVHHPLMYTPINKITADDPLGKKLLTLIENKIGLFAAHTNLDVAEGGTNDMLFDLLGLTAKEPFDGCAGCAGLLQKPVALSELALHLKNLLNLPYINFSGRPEKLLRKAGVCAGDASNPRYGRAALSLGCDVYITGDMRYHNAQEIIETGLAVIDVTHYASEIPIARAMAARINAEAKKTGADLAAEYSAADARVFITK
ncbi:MAG: Nif3-like dinuclear metal center hexameric protein [Defluviitaleaceae bacterium]|nr:Nif3-like dinuclear metal center hexameric protein [Defluviitaleaceae bacterium]